MQVSCNLVAEARESVSWVHKAIASRNFVAVIDRRMQGSRREGHCNLVGRYNAAAEATDRQFESKT